VLYVTVTDTEDFAALDAGNVSIDVSEAFSAVDVAELTEYFPEDEPFGLVESATVIDSVVDLTPYKFRPPGIAGERDMTHPLWRRIRHEVGLAVMKIGGLYRQVRNPGEAENGGGHRDLSRGACVHRGSGDEDCP
jgi:hypothetical protein